MYLTLKYFHLISVIGWIASSSSLGLFLMYKTFILKDKNQQIERKFYRNLVFLEFFFFILVITFGLSMFFLFYFDFKILWIKLKIIIALLFFAPLEVLNLVFVLKSNTYELYKRYDKFVIFITPLLILFGLTVFYLAVFKPI